MEKRLLLAIVLSFLVLVLWQLLFVKKQPQQPAEELQAELEKKPETVPLEKIIPLPEKETPLQEEKYPPVSEKEERQIPIQTSLYHAVLSNRGGILKSWRLIKHKDENKDDLELISVRASELKVYPFSLRTEDPAFDEMANGAYYKASKLSADLEDGQKGEIRFEYADGKGNSIEKIFTFYGGKYDFDTRIIVKKNSREIEPRILWGPGFSNPSPVEQRQRVGRAQGMAALVAGKAYRIDERKYKPEQSVFNFAQWAAYENTYFTAIFLLSPLKNNAEFVKETGEKNIDFFLLVSAPQRVYIGPKDLDVLRDFGNESKKIINFGFFGIIAEILLRAMKLIHRGIPNWGLAIIILTLITKIIFFPLTYSSTRSMAKMQEIQPKLKSLRAKYKKAKQDIAQRRQMNEEMMKLYKEHRINPAGGCLPMIIQLPIFFGFFQILRIAIEFRQSPFIFWIKDLSVKDPYIVTPILMGITQYLSQKITPTSADPTQQRMMLIMPVIFLFAFLSFPSGLVLYWLTQNVLQIAQQLIMNRSMKKKREIHGQRKKRKS